MDKILLIGGGGHCRAVIDVIEMENRYQIAGIIDKQELLGTNVLSYEVIGSDSDLALFAKEYKYAFVTVGQIRSADLRIKLFEKAKKCGFIMPEIISPRAYVSKHANIGEGTIIMHDALVNANVRIGKNCIINSKALIEHDSLIEDTCHISTSAVINGGVVIKKNVFIGSNATIKESVEISGFVKAGELIV